MVSRAIERIVLAIKAAVAGAIVALRVPPNTLTLAALAPTALGAWAMAQGHLRAAAAWIILAGFFDAVDGAVARAQGRITPFGSVLDSVTDRVSDILLYLGAAVYFHRLQAPLYEALSVVALAGALLVSYTRARAENLVQSCQVGFAERGERVVLLLLALILDRLGQAMWLLAGLSWLTSLQRLIHARRALQAGQRRP